MNIYHKDTLLVLTVLILHVLITNCQDDLTGGFGGGGSNAGKMGPFASAGNGGGAFSGGSGGNMNGNQANGKGVSPFAMAAGNAGKGGGGGPFSAGAGDGQNGQGGANPFAIGGGNGDSQNAGANPFQMATDNNGPFQASSQLGGVDMGTEMGGMSSGPGGLAGGAFVTDNNNVNSGTDTYNGDGSGVSKPNNGATSGQLTANAGQAAEIDNSRFNTGEYQQMVQEMFKPDNFDSQLINGNPFDGKGYDLPNYSLNAGSSSSEGGKTHYNTAKDSSVGSYANMDASSTNLQNPYSGNYNEKQTNYMKDDNNAMTNINTGDENFGGGHSSSASNGFQGTPFSADAGTGNMDANNNGNSLMKNPFDISRVDNTMHAQSDTSDMGDTTSNSFSDQYKDNGLDEFGNVHFSELPANGGNAGTGAYGQHNIGSSGSLNLGETPFKLHESSGLNQDMSQQVAYSGDYNSGVAGNKLGTPFGTGDDNDLYRTPFKSADQNTIYGPNMSPSSFGGNSGDNGPMNLAGNPGGNPFNQGGTSMGMNSMPRGRRSLFRTTWK